MKSAVRRAVEGAAGVVLHQIALRFRLLSAPRFSLHRLWVLQAFRFSLFRPSRYRLRSGKLTLLGSIIIYCETSNAGLRRLLC